MITKDPLVSVIIPSYNYAHFLPETLESVINQTWANWECIIINDGSTDNTEMVSLEYCKKDNRICYYAQSNGGLSSARNTGIKLSRGEYLLFLDADDIIHPDKIIKHLNYFESNISAHVVYSNFSYFYETGVYIDSPFKRVKLNEDAFSDFLLNWGFEFVIPIHSPIIKSYLIKDNNIWFEESLRAREDWLFWIKLTQLKAKFVFIDERLSFYRKHVSSMVYNSEHMITNTIIACFRVYEMLPANLKPEFENKYSKYLSKSLEESKNNLLQFHNSRIYIIYRKLKKLKSFFK
jgi:glycosyltransferase involved in cell wall biosynthesis